MVVICDEDRMVHGGAISEPAEASDKGNFVPSHFPAGVGATVWVVVCVEGHVLLRAELLESGIGPNNLLST
jgi:hypothetical protein